jgi:hypothetical protein
VTSYAVRKKTPQFLSSRFLQANRTQVSHRFTSQHKQARHNALSFEWVEFWLFKIMSELNFDFYWIFRHDLLFATLTVPKHNRWEGREGELWNEKVSDSWGAREEENGTTQEIPKDEGKKLGKKPKDAFKASQFGAMQKVTKLQAQTSKLWCYPRSPISFNSRNFIAFQVRVRLMLCRCYLWRSLSLANENANAHWSSSLNRLKVKGNSR